LVAIESKLNQEKNMSTSVMTKAQHWHLVLKMSYEAGARNAIGLGVKPAAIKAAIRRHREREEAARENLDLLAAREPGSVGRCSALARPSMKPTSGPRRMVTRPTRRSPTSLPSRAT